MMNGIDTESVNASRQPKPQDIQHRCPDFRIAPVQVRLRGKIGMVLILAAGLIEGPCGSAEFAEPVVRRSAPIGLWIAPDIAISFRTRSRGPAFDEPGMLIGRVVRHEVQDEL